VIKSVREKTWAEDKENRAWKSLAYFLGNIQVIHLCRNVGDGSLSDKLHTMDPSIPRSCCLWLLIDGAGRSENMFERLYMIVIFSLNIDYPIFQLTETKTPLRRRPFQGSSSS
jgi:hypothetical protein